MKVMKAIIFADSLKPNAFTAELKLVWLNELEGRIQSLIHNVKPEELVKYTLPDDEETAMIVPAPYDNVYWKWLCAMIDYANGEYDKYINAQMAANQSYHDYAKWVIRTGYELPQKEEEEMPDDPDEGLEGVLPGE